jgi:hypothetical protein
MGTSLIPTSVSVYVARMDTAQRVVLSPGQAAASRGFVLRARLRRQLAFYLALSCTNSDG